MSTVIRPPVPAPLQILHYATPVAIASYYLITAILNACFLQRASTKPGPDHLRFTTLLLGPAVGVTYAANAILYIFHALVKKGWWASQDSVVHALGSILVWSVVFVLTLGSESLRWTQHAGAWLTALALEIAICAVSIQYAPGQTGFDKAELASQVLRIVLFTTACTYGLVVLIRRTSGKSVPPATIDETEPLLARPSTSSSGSSTAANDDYGSVAQAVTETPPEDDEETKQKKAQEEQQRHIEEAGGWWNYLKNFVVFLPYLWPSKNRLMQFYLVVIGLFILAGRVFHVLIPRQLGIVVDKLTETAGTGILPWNEIGIFFLLEFLGNDAILYSLQDCISLRLNMWSWKQLEMMAFKHVMDLSMDFHDNKDSGEVIKAVEQANSLNRIVHLVLFDLAPILLDLLIGVGYVTHLFDIYFAFILLFSAIPFFLVSYFGTRLNQSYRRVRTEKSRFLSKIQFQSISNWPLVTYFNRSRFEQQRLNEAVTESAETSIQYNDVANATMAGQDMVMFMAQLGLMLLAAYRVSQGEKPVGNFVALKSFWNTLTYPIWVLAHFSRNLTNLLVDAERMLQLIRTKPSVTDKPDAEDIVITKGAVEFKDVGFFYDKRKDTIQNINFSVPGGSTVALVGETGSGKSTLLKLLFRFYDVSSGSITIDGQDLRDVRLQSLREALGNVPQSGSLFNDTILENVRYARLDATDAEVEDACKAACIHEKITSFPDAYHTKVGERGVKLSGGELQRVSIARVILKNPQIVLLDEATSAVDSATESAIQEAFTKLTKGRTTFVIAHRLSTIMDADMILVVDKGEIAENGTHDQLLGMDGKYAMLWETQTNKGRKMKEDASKLLDI